MGLKDKQGPLPTKPRGENSPQGIQGRYDLVLLFVAAKLMIIECRIIAS